MSSIDDNNNNNNSDKVSKESVDMTQGNENIQSTFNPIILKKMDEMIATIIGDDTLTEADVMTLAYNFSWYFLTDHIRALKQSRYKHVRDNYDQFFMDSIFTYLTVVSGQSQIIQYMLDNNCKTIDEYLAHKAANTANNKENNTQQ